MLGGKRLRLAFMLDAQARGCPDALADNRGELLFELRGETSRQFVLYRVMRGRADKLFVSGGGYYGTLSEQ